MDGVIHKHPVVFSHDSNLFFVAAGSRVHIHAVGSPEPLGSLTGHEKLVTCIVRNPNNRFQLLTSSLDGTVRLWDYTEATCLASWTVNHFKHPGLQFPIHKLCLGDPAVAHIPSPPPSSSPVSRNPSPPSSPSERVALKSASQEGGEVGGDEEEKGGGSGREYRAHRPPRDFMMYISIEWPAEEGEEEEGSKGGSSFRIASLSLRLGEARGWVTLLFEMENPYHYMAINNSQTTLAVAGGYHLAVLRLDVPSDKRRVVRRSLSSKATALAFHPHLDLIATGNQEGRATFWYNFCESDFATTSLHWHAHPLHAIAFSVDGAYMFTGGEEAVLVIWQMETKRKQFLPRLGSIIRHISLSPDGSIYALALADNSLKFVDAISSKPTLTVRGLALAHSLPGERKARGGVGRSRERLVADPRSCTLLCRGVPGRLQVYDPLWQGAGGGQGRVIGELRIAMRSQVSRTERMKQKQRVLTVGDRIDFFQLDTTGTWLATLEAATVDITACHSKIKFWHRPPAHSSFQLAATVRNPHKTEVVDMKFKPMCPGRGDELPSLVTLAKDNTFKFWRPTPIGKPLGANGLGMGQEGATWSSVGSGEFQKGVPARCLCFSQDGSVMAIAYGSLATIWDTQTLTLVHTLAHGSASESVRLMEFSGGFLVTATSRKLVIWDLVRLVPISTHFAKVVSIAVSPVTGAGTPSGPRVSVLIRIPREDESKEVNIYGRRPTPRFRYNGGGIKMCSDGVIAEFDLRNPSRPSHIEWARVPIRKQGGLCYVGGGASTPSGWPVLVYLSDGYEVCVAHGFGGGGQNEVRVEKRSKKGESQAKKEPVSIFEHFYGGDRKSMGDSTSELTVKRVGEEAIGPREKRIRELLDAPSHILQDAHSLFSSMMEILLPKAPLPSHNPDSNSNPKQNPNTNFNPREELLEANTEESAKEWQKMDIETFASAAPKGPDPFAVSPSVFQYMIEEPPSRHPDLGTQKKDLGTQEKDLGIQGKDLGTQDKDLGTRNKGLSSKKHKASNRRKSGGIEEEKGETGVEKRKRRESSGSISGKRKRVLDSGKGKKRVKAKSKTRRKSSGK